MKTDVLIVGTGCSGLYFALQVPQEKQVLMITKSEVEKSDSFLAQGGICMLPEEKDYDAFFEDTMRAGHYENNPESVSIMIRSSQDVISDLVSYGAEFAKKEDGSFLFTKEGAHSRPRILFHEDETGREITSHLLKEVEKRENITILDRMEMVDLLEKQNTCYGIVACNPGGDCFAIEASYTILATGGVGGLYPHSTNFPHLTGDSLALALRHNVACQNLNYVQIHPTTFYTKEKKERSFLISESVRGEGAKLYDKNGKRFVSELLPRDLLTEAILNQMKKDHTDFVWEDLRPIPKEEREKHFPNILAYCREHGYDPDKECIPVVPAQHYFMGGVQVDVDSKTTMEHLYAVGETACNGVHGKNRLASNSLLESLVFAKRAANSMLKNWEVPGFSVDTEVPDYSKYANMDAWRAENKAIIEREMKVEEKNQISA